MRAKDPHSESIPFAHIAAKLELGKMITRRNRFKDGFCIFGLCDSYRGQKNGSLQSIVSSESLESSFRTFVYIHLYLGLISL